MTLKLHKKAESALAASKLRIAAASVGALVLAGCNFSGPGEADLEALLKSCQYTNPKIVSQSCRLMAHGQSYECAITFKPHVDVEVLKSVRLIAASGPNGWVMIEREDL